MSHSMSSSRLNLFFRPSAQTQNFPPSALSTGQHAYHSLNSAQFAAA